jgi:hypothetical protein
MEKNGEIVAIIPRSFCNGTYYRPFRKLLLTQTAIKHIHLFGKRDRAFKDDNVLQENVILLLEKGGTVKDITISTSIDATFTDYKEVKHTASEIFIWKDKELFIHVPTNYVVLPDKFKFTLKQLGIGVSTGPVVDFRLSVHLRKIPVQGTVPLLYSTHCGNGKIRWPVDGKSPNAIMLNDETRKWLFPNGWYVVVRRFSSKEEKRRIVASVVDPHKLNTDYLGFENHLNVFHTEKNGLDVELA